MKRSWLFLLGLVLLAVLSACGGGDNSSATSNVSFSDQPMTQAEVDALKLGDQAYAMVEREDGIKFIPITLGNRYTLGSADYLTFRDSDSQFGSGDSGSPIIGKNGKTIGALSGTFGGDNIAVTPITAMLAIAEGSSTALASVSMQNRLAWFAMGISKKGKEGLRLSGIPVAEFEPLPSMQQASVKNSLATASSGLGPGYSMAVVPFDGPLVNLFAIGTVTHTVDSDRLIAFGHPMNWDGQPHFSMPVTAARVVQFVHDPLFGNFKLAVPNGSIQGGIVQDRSSGIMVSRTANIEWVELIVNVDGKTTTHRVCKTDDQNLEFSLVVNGLQSVVENQLDSFNPSTLRTLITITYSNDTVSSLDLGDLNWSFEGSIRVWDAIESNFLIIKSVEITLS